MREEKSGTSQILSKQPKKFWDTTKKHQLNNLPSSNKILNSLKNVYTILSLVSVHFILFDSLQFEFVKLILISA